MSQMAQNSVRMTAEGREPPSEPGTKRKIFTTSAAKHDESVCRLHSLT